jgi:hypothetical protein
MSKIMNAFHPDYIKTYHPNFLTDIRLESRMTRAGQALSAHVDEVRKTKPSHGTVFGISDKEISATAPAHMHRSKPKKLNLERTEFHTYSRAGTAKRPA